MCRHRKSRENKEKFINILWCGRDPSMIVPRRLPFWPTSQTHITTKPTLHIKRDFFHLKSWVVSCIEQKQSGANKMERKRRNIITRRKSNRCDDIFLMLLKSKQATAEKEENFPAEKIVFHFFSASAELLWKKIPFISKTHEILWDSFNTGEGFFASAVFPFLFCCCLLMGAFFFPFILWFI